MAINVPIITTFADKGVNAAQKAFGDLSKSTLIAGAAIGAAVTAVAAFGYSAIQKASDFNEAISKNTVVFGAISKEVENFAQTANRALGISETAALSAAGTFAIFGKSAGLAGKDLSDFSIELVTLASDLASFSNTKVDDAINALGSALRGEAEPLRKYGVLLDDATLKAAATELGIYSGSKALTAQQKVLAAQKVIFEQTADAQGDFGRTSTGLAAQQKILGATLENIQTNLGQAFLPLFLKAVKFFNDKVTPAFERVAEVIGEKGIVKGMQQAVYEMGSFGPKVVAVMKTIAVAALITANAVGYIGQAANMAWQEMKQLFRVKGLVLNLLGPLGQVVKVVDQIRGQSGGGGFKQLFDIEGLKADFDKFSAGIKNMGSASDYSSFAAKQLAENAQAAADAADELSGTGTGKGATGAADKLKKMQKAAQEAAETLAKETAAAVKEAADALNKELAEALDTAKTNLKDAQTKFSDFSTSVNEGVTGAFSFKDAQDAGKETGAGFITGLQDQVKKIAGYSYKVNELLRMGLSEESLKNVLAAGFESGNLIADYLIAGGAKTISETNALVQSVQDMGVGIGMAAANVFYSSGVSNAQDYLKGVEDAFARAQGKLQGKGLTLADVKGISAGFYDEVQNGYTPTALEQFMNGGGNLSANDNPNIVYNINVSGVMSNAETGEVIINNIRAYNRAAGPANIAVA